MKDENSLYWIWLSEKCGIASKEFGKLAERYDNPFDLYRLEEEEVERLEGIGTALKSRLCDKSLDSAYSALRYCKQNQVHIISYADSRYPARLRNIEDPPVVLYALGNLPNMNDRLCIGIVGTRKMSEYGRQTAYKISYELASADTVIVSGMALGVDGVAACGALACGGSTVAVLGCGISVVYPKEHEILMKEIAKHGAVITEYPPAQAPNGHNFPKRNRIISGLCQGVLVVEGAVGSGALITANRAIDQGRELFALPGKVNESNSEGPNELIRNGAHVALCAEDILRQYDFLYHDMIDYKGLSKAKRRQVPEDSALKKYGVSSVYYRGNYHTFKEKKQRTPSFEIPQGENVFSRPDGNNHAHPLLRKDPRQEENSLASNIAHEGGSESKSGSDRETVSDSGSEILSALDEVSRKVFASMPIGQTVTPDRIAAEGVGIGDIITSLTLLELSGLVGSVPGGMYIRKQ